MSNAITRAIPKAVQNKSKTTVSRTGYRVSKLTYWFSENWQEIIIWLGGAILTGLIVLAIGLAVYIPIHHANQNIWKAAEAYHYKPNETAYCDHGNDSSVATNAGWIPCTVVSTNNPGYTSYFVSYGTQQANITPNHMHRTVQK